MSDNCEPWFENLTTIVVRFAATLSQIHLSLNRWTLAVFSVSQPFLIVISIL